MLKINYLAGEQNNYEQENVAVKPYSGEFEGVSRQIIIGFKENSQNIHMRYFRFELGRHSNLEQHSYAHGVMIFPGWARTSSDQ